MNIDLDEVDRNIFTINFTNQTSTVGSIFYTTNASQAPQYQFDSFGNGLKATAVRFPFRVTQFCQNHQLNKKYKVWYSLSTIMSESTTVFPGDGVYMLGLKFEGSLTNTYFYGGTTNWVGQLNRVSTMQGNATAGLSHRTGIYTAVVDNPPFIVDLSSECTYIELQIPYINSSGVVAYLNLNPTADPPTNYQRVPPAVTDPGVSFILQLHLEEL